ncbi:MFS transporter [Orbus sturtevantii]|uniref:MFS transporter n=1 Tax=Orbus sturtevantii TaxID=3074109 RepID=UPI00370D5CC5
MAFNISKNDGKLRKARNIAGITMGNAIEFYDFAIYGTYAVLLGQLFFPGTNNFEKLMLSFATLGVGFITRPLGAILIGLYADKFGRRPALLFTLWLMSIGTLLFVITPTYQQIGIWATVIIMFARLMQGFALGGEFGTSTTMLMEYADNSNRGFYSSWQLFGQGLNTLLASIVGITIGFWLKDDITALHSWGWRLAFAIGLLIVPMALYIRKTLPETKNKNVNESTSALLKLVFSKYPKQLITGILLTLGSTVPVYITLFYLANFAISELQFEMRSSIVASCIAASVQIILVPFIGMLSDKVGRKPLIFWSRVLTILVIYPIFMLLTLFPSLTTLYSCVFVLAILIAVNSVPSLIVCAEIFPSKIRATGLSVVYSLSVAIFGGFAQMIVTGLAHWMNDLRAPAYYVIATVAISLIGVFMFKETAGKALK